MSASIPVGDDLLSTAQTSELTSIPEGTLRNWRHRRIGPPSFTFNGSIVRYRRSDVLAWMAAQYEATATGQPTVHTTKLKGTA